MSVRTLWFLAPAPDLAALMVRHRQPFLDWYLQWYTPFPDEWEPDLVSMAIQLVIQGPTFLSPVTLTHAHALDSLMAEFCWSFTNGGGILHDGGPSLVRAEHYQDCQHWIARYGAPLVQTLWPYVVHGRGLRRDAAQQAAFPLGPDAIGVGWWTAQECQQVLPELRALWPIVPIPTQHCVTWAIHAVEQAVAHDYSVVILTC